MKMSTRYVLVKKSLLEEPENISLLFITIPICENYSINIFTLYFPINIGDKVTLKKVRGENIVWIPQGMLLGQAVKITCKHHRLLLQQQSLAMNHYTTISLSLWKLFPHFKKSNSWCLRINKCKQMSWGGGLP